MASDFVLYQGSQEWSAVYHDGGLVSAGDHAVVIEKLLALLQVAVISSDDFLQGGDSHASVAQSLDELQEYRRAREELEHEASELERQADALRARAQTLRAKA